MSNLVNHAKQEFLALGYKPVEELDDDDMNKWVQENVLELVTVFASQGHSGMSAPYVLALFDKMASFEPACPLTGEDSEWHEVSRDGVYQNKRCGHVFKDETGAYDIEGKIFRDADGCCFTSGDSRVYIEFPYTPKSEYVDV